jgi:transcriptional regulator with XRE-family HTH domain
MLGERLRSMRQQHEIGLRELAGRIGVSPALISQIETGKSMPSVATLYAIVSELGVSLDAVLAEAPDAAEPPPSVPPPAAPAARVPAPQVQRADARAALELSSGVRWERLTAEPDPDVDFLFVEYAVGGASSAGELMRHPGHERGLVLAGRLEIQLAFERVVLEAGESASFPSTTPHRLSNAGDVPVQALWLVIGRHGEDRVG